MNPVVHFEMPFDDRARLARFYEQAFGWQMQPLGEAMGDYVLADAWNLHRLAEHLAAGILHLGHRGADVVHGDHH